MVSRATGGALAWSSVAQLFVVEELTRRSWTLPYSRRSNYVSDLGATTCGPHFGRELCSPNHEWINLSFGVVGGAIVLGAVLLRPGAPDLLRQPLPVLYVASGAGAALIGAFPLDTNRPMHALGASLFLGGTNLAHVLLGARLHRHHARPYGLALIVLGGGGLVGAGLVAAGSSLGVGIGFVQRLTVYGSVAGFVASGLLVRAAVRRAATLAP